MQVLELMGRFSNQPVADRLDDRDDDQQQNQNHEGDVPHLALPAKADRQIPQTAGTNGTYDRDLTNDGDQTDRNASDHAGHVLFEVDIGDDLPGAHAHRNGRFDNSMRNFFHGRFQLSGHHWHGADNQWYESHLDADRGVENDSGQTNQQRDQNHERDRPKEVDDFVQNPEYGFVRSQSAGFGNHDQHRHGQRDDEGYHAGDQKHDQCVDNGIRENVEVFDDVGNPFSQYVHA